MPRIEVTEAEARVYREVVRQALIHVEWTAKERRDLIALGGLFDAALGRPSIRQRQEEQTPNAILDRLVANLEEHQALLQERERLLADYGRGREGQRRAQQGAACYVPVLEGDEDGAP